MAHVANTASQYNVEPLPRQATRNPKSGDLAAHFHEEPVSLSMATNAKVISFFNETIREVESFLIDQAESHAYDDYYRLRSIPGVGAILALVFLYEIQDVGRFPSVGDPEA
jgi:transposase